MTFEELLRRCDDWNLTVSITRDIDRAFDKVNPWYCAVSKIVSGVEIRAHAFAPIAKEALDSAINHYERMTSGNPLPGFRQPQIEG